MTDDRYQQMTANHSAALERMGEIEKGRRKDRWTTIFSLLGVLTAGGGGGFAYMQDTAQDEDFQTIVATHIATNEQWQDGVDADIEKIQDSIDDLRVVVIRLQTLSDVQDHGEIESLLRQLGEKSRATNRRAGKASPSDVRRVQEQLFAD